MDGAYHAVYGAVLPNELFLELSGHVQQTRRFGFGNPAYGHRSDHGNHFGNGVGSHFPHVGALFIYPFFPFPGNGRYQKPLFFAELGGFYEIGCSCCRAFLRYNAIHFAFQIGQYLGHFQVRYMHVRSGLVQHVNGLVGQAAVGDVAFGKPHTGFERLRRILNQVMFFVFRRDVSENLQSVLIIGRLYHHFLEAAFQSAVFFYILAVFIGCAGSYALNLATGHSRF